MRRTLSTLLVCLISQQTLLCFQYVKEVSTNYSYAVVESGRLTLELDEQTVHPWVMGSYFQYIPETKKLAYLNKVGYSIKLFDLNSGKTEHTVPLSRYGPDDVGNEPVAFYWLNRDSIFVFSDLNNGRLSLINDKGKKIKGYELQSKDDKHFVELAEVAGGMVYDKGHLYLGLRVVDFMQMPHESGVISLDVKSGEISYLEHPLPVDQSNVESIPIDQRYSSVYVDVNSDEKKLLLNFPLSNELLVRTEEGHWYKQSAKSHYFDDLVFLSKPMRSYGGTTPEYRDEVRFMPRYTGVFYDSYRKVYYRVGRLTYNRELHEQRLSGAKVKIYQEFSIQVFDSGFRKIAENKFFTNGILYEQGLFINEEGLWLLCPQKDNEDVMDFKLMKLTKKN